MKILVVALGLLVVAGPAFAESAVAKKFDAGPAEQGNMERHHHKTMMKKHMAKPMMHKTM